MNILVTAFEPFGEREVNASLSVLHQLPDQIGKWNIIKEVLPVDYQSAPERVSLLLDTEQPQAVICLGEASGSDYLRLEFVAINWMDFRIPDNQGLSVTDQRISATGSTAYFSSLPLRKMEAILQDNDIPVKISTTAGTYLCNLVFYTLMHQLDETGISIPAGFIHLPAEVVGEETAQIQCTLPLCTKGLNLILNNLINEDMSQGKVLDSLQF
jgi:pyroglutamyl-peptidase